ncbi:hypothetical protein ACFFGV_05990 [Pontibacillus salicampi]|uniref:Lipoprotein n=1 Tax=Pontibacillus salicampi TaxID=1449801 RepID=A0ABV6LL59_9BACI
MARKPILALILAAFFLSGCLYPDEKLSKNQVPNDVQLQSIQTAIEQFIEKHPYQLPIQNREQDTPVLQKYPVDFSRLKEENILSEAPGNSFEQGGVYQYVLIHAEENPTVKVMDLRVTQKLREVNMRLIAYRNEHRYPPFGEVIGENVYSINHQELGYDEPPQIKSPYTQNHLPIVIDGNGELYIDYRPDLNQYLQQYDHSYTSGDDIRYVLAENSPIVPAHSLPYTVKDGEPVFSVGLQEKEGN